MVDGGKTVAVVDEGAIDAASSRAIDNGAGSGCAAQASSSSACCRGFGRDKVFGIAGVGCDRQQQAQGEDEAVEGSGHIGVLEATA
jgi:hypothetical protein